MSLLCVVRDPLGSEGVLLSNELAGRTGLWRGTTACEFVMCSVGRTGQWRGTPAARVCYVITNHHQSRR